MSANLKKVQPTTSVGGVLFDQALWVDLCVSRLLELDASVERDEAVQMARAVWSLERFRSKSPDTVAHLLLNNGAIRP